MSIPIFPALRAPEPKSLEILGLVIQMRRPVSGRVRLAVLGTQIR
ncbi:hypothetical protein [Methylococcus capsulatus]|jgi:hypothetical protein|nr:hypothetical protein [Methylococcus capsulatus]